MRIAGAPYSPRFSTSQPLPASNEWRAAARHVACAIWQPVTSAKLEEGGICSNSLSHVPTTSSTIEAAGEHAYRAAFWSHADVSQSAANAAGKVPPIAQPNERPPAVRSG